MEMMYKGYTIHDDGRIFNRKWKRMCKNHKNENRYLSLRIGYSERWLAHRLIATLHIPNLDNLPEVLHKDGNKGNNEVSNLLWCTHAHLLSHNLSPAPDVVSSSVVSANTKELMSLAKMGSLHPRFQGWIEHNGIRHDSARKLSAEIGISYFKVRRLARLGLNGFSFIKKVSVGIPTDNKL